MPLAFRALLLLLIALVPAGLAQVILEREAQEARRGQVYEQALLLARMVASQQERTFEGARQLLAAMAAHEALRAAIPSAECDRFLARLLAQYPRYRAVNLFGLDGAPVCSASPGIAGINISDRRYFQDVVAHAGFAVGRYAIGRLTGEPTLHLAAPLRDNDGELRGVLTLALSLDWLVADLEALALPPASVATITDADGVVLARHPEGRRFMGVQIPAELAWMVRHTEPTSTEATGLDGVRRFVGLVPVQEPERSLLVVTALPGDAMVADQLRAERRATLLIVAALLCSLILAIAAFHRAVDWPVRRLLRAAEAWSREEWSARVDRLGGTQGEFARIGASLNAMAEAVGIAEQARMTAIARVTALSEVSPQVAFTADPAGRIDWLNPYGRRLIGLELADGPTRSWLHAVHREDRPRAIAAWRAARTDAQAGGPGAFETELRIGSPPNPAWRWYLCRAAPVRNAAGRITAWAGAGLDVHELRMARALAAERLEQLEAIYRNAPVGLCLFDRNLRFLAINALLAASNGASPEAHIGRSLAEMAPAVAHAIEPRLHILLATGEPQRFEVQTARLNGRPAPSTWLCSYDAVVDAQGRVTGLSGSALDVTDLKLAEEQAKLLAQEVDHRARNVLAVLRSLIRLSAAESPGSVPAMVEALAGRVDAMGRVHTLLSNERWRSAELAEIIRAETAAHAAQVVLDGGPVRLLAEAAQPMTLMLHELLTNAAKYGALSRPEGRLTLSWRRDGDGVVLEWREQGGPPVAGTPTRLGFGTALIDANGSAPLDGRIERVWARQGLFCRIHIGPAALRGD